MKLKRNAIKCNKCEVTIESRHVHDFVTCACGAVFTDGGTSYIRRGGDLSSMHILDVFESEADDEEEEDTATH